MPIPALARTNPDRGKPVLLPIAQDLLREALRAQRKTVTALAAELGMSRKHLSNVLHGHAPVAMPLLRRLGDTLGVEPELLPAGPRPRGPAGSLRLHAGLDRGAWRSDRADGEGWEMLED
jgi:transcriptional regulator with XRE-family HTH domain